MEEKLIIRLRDAEDVTLIARLRESGENITGLFMSFLREYLEEVEDVA